MLPLLVFASLSYTVLSQDFYCYDATDESCNPYNPFKDNDRPQYGLFKDLRYTEFKDNEVLAYNDWLPAPLRGFVGNSKHLFTVNTSEQAVLMPKDLTQEGNDFAHQVGERVMGRLIPYKKELIAVFLVWTETVDNKVCMTCPLRAIGYLRDTVHLRDTVSETPFTSRYTHFTTDVEDSVGLDVVALAYGYELKFHPYYKVQSYRCLESPVEETMTLKMIGLIDRSLEIGNHYHLEPIAKLGNNSRITLDLHGRQRTAVCQGTRTGLPDNERCGRRKNMTTYIVTAKKDRSDDSQVTGAFFDMNVRFQLRLQDVLQGGCGGSDKKFELVNYPNWDVKGVLLHYLWKQEGTCVEMPKLVQAYFGDLTTLLRNPYRMSTGDVFERFRILASSKFKRGIFFNGEMFAGDLKERGVHVFFGVSRYMNDRCRGYRERYDCCRSDTEFIKYGSRVRSRFVTPASGFLLDSSDVQCASNEPAKGRIHVISQASDKPNQNNEREQYLYLTMSCPTTQCTIATDGGKGFTYTSLPRDYFTTHGPRGDPNHYVLLTFLAADFYGAQMRRANKNITFVELVVEEGKCYRCYDYKSAELMHFMVLTTGRALTNKGKAGFDAPTKLKSANRWGYRNLGSGQVVNWGKQLTKFPLKTVNAANPSQEVSMCSSQCTQTEFRYHVEFHDKSLDFTVVVSSGSEPTFEMKKKENGGSYQSVGTFNSNEAVKKWGEAMIAFMKE